MFCMKPIWLNPLHSRPTVHALSRALMTRLFDYGMQDQEQRLESLCKDPLNLSHPLHSRPMVPTLSRALMTRLFGYGMQHLAKPLGDFHKAFLVQSCLVHLLT